MSSPKPLLDDLRIERRPERVGRAKPALVTAATLLVLLVAGTVWWFLRSSPIEVNTAVAREISTASGERTILNASGYVTARRQATASSKVTGKVIEVLIEEGMSVKAGQVLARLDDTNVKAGLEVAQAQWESAKAALDETRAQLKQATQEFQRIGELAKRNIASASDLDKAESDAATLRARLARQQLDVTVAERTITTWQQQMDDLIIRAPFSGVVTTKDSQPGEMISPISAGGGFTRTGIGTIVDMSSLEIEIDVNESYINRVEPGQAVEATLDAYPDWKIPCKVVAIIPTADRQKSTVKVRVGFDKLDARVLPEMSAKVAFRQTSTGAASGNRMVLIPKGAIQNRDGRDEVFVIHNQRAERRAVTVSGVQNDEAAISAGLAGSEKVVVDPPQALKDGASVKERSHER
jgi:RND family efflux transporter MFP subunit